MTAFALGDEDLENREEKKKYLKRWLDGYHTATNALPFIENEIEKTDWEIEVLSNLPECSDEIIDYQILPNLRNDLETTKRNFPMIDVSKMPSTAATSSTGTALIYEYISRFGDLQDEEARSFSFTYRSAYEDLQRKQNRMGEVRKLLESFYEEDLLLRFDNACREYSQFQTDPHFRQGAAGVIRTFLYGLEGQIIIKAKKWPKENKPSWQEIAARLSCEKDNAILVHIVESWGRKYTQYVSRLSDILKDRERGSETDLTVLWTKLLEEVYSLLNAIKF